MTRETRLNLIWLAVVLVLLAPGAVMLVKHKMKPTLRPAWEPDPVRRTVAYMVPGEVPPGMERVNPDRTAQWIRELMQQHSIGALNLPVDSDGMPLMSEKKSFQLLAVTSVENLPHVILLTWDPRWNESAHAWSLVDDKGVIDAINVHESVVEVPDLVRQELGENGLLVPPKQVKWEEITFARNPVGDAKMIRQGEGNEKDSLKIVTPFTSQAASRNYVNSP